MFLVALLDVDLNSVPGQCSLNRLGSTNREVFGVTETGYDIAKVTVVKAAVWHRYTQVLEGNKLADPIKVFIKQEPHKREKIEDGRLRLIMSVSLVDALVDRILFMKLMWKVVNNYHKTGIMIGWSPVNGGYRLLESKFSGKTLSMDKKTWDWSVPAWLLDAVCDVIMSLSVSAPVWWKKAVRTRFDCLFEDPEFVFSDGSRAKQSQPGIMKSGCYLTILINSVAQILLHEMAIFSLSIPREETEPLLVVGDDTLQKWFDRYLECVAYWSSLGFKIEVEQHSGEPEFAGFKYKNGYIPAYRQKHYFQLAYLTPNRELAQQTLQNYQILYWFDKDMLDVIVSIARMLKMPEAILDHSLLSAIAQG